MTIETLLATLADSGWTITQIAQRQRGWVSRATRDLPPPHTNHIRAEVREYWGTTLTESLTRVINGESRGVEPFKPIEKQITYIEPNDVLDFRAALGLGSPSPLMIKRRF